MNQPSLRIALLDLYEGQANQGMRCLREIFYDWGKARNWQIVLTEYDVRQKKELPGLDHDVYVSSGGPGSPLDSEGSDWENAYFEWIGQLEQWNASPDRVAKHCFFICHSFQLACRYFEAGTVCKRNSTAFGVFPVHMLSKGLDEPIFKGLKDPFFSVDSRDYQVIAPQHEKIRARGGSILAIEKYRPHVAFERAVMAIRFTPYFMGTQFHPEADAVGMRMYLERADKKQTVIDNHGEAKWKSMTEQLMDPEKILWTYSHVMPNFLALATEEWAMASQESLNL
ncbi:MAG: GMP synthase [Sphingobacteriia bacterium]|nr:MAG: GMP synthase [Sphingobacteriia bacterium]